MKIFVNRNQRILGFEAVLFSALFAVIFQSWVLLVVMFPALIWLVRRNSITCLSVIFSLLWGFIAFSIGYSINLICGLIFGVLCFLLGITMHMSELDKPKMRRPRSANYDYIRWPINSRHRWQNFN